MHNGLTWVSTGTFYRNYSVVDFLPVPGFAAGDQFGGPFGSDYIQQGKPVSWVVNTSFTNAAGRPRGDRQRTAGLHGKLVATSSTSSASTCTGLSTGPKGGTTANLTIAATSTSARVCWADSAGTNRRHCAAQPRRLAPYAEPAIVSQAARGHAEYDLPHSGLARHRRPCGSRLLGSALRTQPDPDRTRTTRGSTPR